MLIQRWFFSKMYRVLHHSMMALSLNYYSGRLPKWGTMHNGDISELVTLVRPIKENAGFAWLTPIKNDGVKSGEIANRYENGLVAQVLHYPTPSATDGNRGVSINPDLFGESETGALYRKSETTGTRWGMNLTQFASMESAKNWVLFNSQDKSGGTGEKQIKHDIERAYLRGQVKETDSKLQLNPDWVELLMGYPIGWTDINSHHPETYPNMDLSHHELPIESNTDAIE